VEPDAEGKDFSEDDAPVVRAHGAAAAAAAAAAAPRQRAHGAAAAPAAAAAAMRGPGGAAAGASRLSINSPASSAAESGESVIDVSPLLGKSLVGSVSLC
jgi:hypothetical protein